MTDIKPPTPCPSCWPDGTCDKVALVFGFCGMARLLDAIENGIEEEQ